MSDNQRTLAKEISFTGVGLHTGETVNIKISPAEAGHWFSFIREDLEEKPEIKAHHSNVVSTERSTTLGKGGAKVYTVEHVLSALIGCGVDNATISLDGPEVPILDGSAKPFVDAIVEAGTVEQDAPREYIDLDENVPFEDPNTGAEFLVVPDKLLRITVMVDYNSPVLGTQHATMYGIEEFAENISSCRTFCFLKELEFLAKNDLIKGGDLDNAIVLVERSDVSQEELDRLAKLLGKERVKVDYTGIGTLNNCELQFENEPARHKLLDIVGDFALLGKRLNAHVLAARPGHAGNVAFVKHLAGVLKSKSGQGPSVDLSNALFDINQIESMLPHRYPFLLVDRIVHMDSEGVVGYKNITMNEPQFTGHFPGNPVMPGVLQVEAMAQVGGIFALNQVDEPEKWMTYFLKIDGVKFKRKVIPGDTLVMEMKLITPIRRGIVHMMGRAYVDGQLACEAELMAQIVKEKE